MIGLKKYRELLLDLGADVLGSVLMGIGIYSFAEQADIAPGGLSGIAILFKYLWDLPVGVMILIMNIPLLLIAWKYLGKRFAIRTLRTVVLSSVILDVVVTPLAFVYAGDRLLSAIASGVCLGAGLGVIFARGSTTGGTDIISCLVERKNPHLQVGGILTAVDILIIALSIAVFGNLESGLYGIVALYAQGRVMDAILYGRKRGRSVMIFSEKREEIARRIMREMDRGATFLQSRGAYSGARSEVLLCAVGQREYAKLRRIVRECDPEAFFVVLETKNVYGEGFQPINEET
ncbi:MAG: YitT family protein [Clostridiales bacterium]|nr:YitT family protein [Clostridiales bacterium]